MGRVVVTAFLTAHQTAQDMPRERNSIPTPCGARVWGTEVGYARVVFISTHEDDFEDD